jgi:hypothetical protein
MTPTVTTNSRDQQTVTFADDPAYQKSQQMLDFEKKIASGEIQESGLYGRALDGGRERTAFAERESAYTSYDPATNIVRFYDPEGNVTQEGQRTSGNIYGDGFLGSTLSGLSSGLNKISADPNFQRAVTAAAIAVVAPYATAQLASSLSGLGAYAGVTAQAITSITIQVAQGVPIEKATENALVNVALSGATGAVQQQIGKVISSPGVTNAITSTVSSGLATAAKGGSQADVEKAMTAGLVSSAASTAYKDAVDSTSTIASRAVGGAAGGAVTGGTEGAVVGGLSSAASALASQLVPPPASTPTPAVETGKTAGLSPEQISSQIDKIIEQAPGVQTAGALPLAEMTASAALQQAEPLIRLVSEAANDPNYKVLLPAIQQRLGQLGLTIAEVASRINPAVLAAQLATYSPNAGDPNEDAKMAQIYRDYAGLKMPSAVTPIETTPIQSAPVGGLDITQEQSQAETERLARQNELLTPPTPEIAPAPEIPSAPEPALAEPATVIRVDPSTETALVINSTGDIFTVTVDPSTTAGSTVLVPAPTPEPAPQPAPEPPLVPEPAPQPVLEPAPEPVPAPIPVPVTKPVVEPVPPVPTPTPTPEPIPAPNPDQAILDLINPPVVEPAPVPAPSPVPAPEPAPQLVPELPPTPQPVPAPVQEPVVTPVSVPVSEIVPEVPSAPTPTPIPSPDQPILDLINPPAVEPTPAPEPVLAPEITPVPTPEPVPAPAPSPDQAILDLINPPVVEPTPAPEITPAPQPAPAPEFVPEIPPASVPAPRPMPEIVPAPEPVIRPEPQPEPAPIFVPEVSPVPVPEPVPLPSPVLEPVTDTPPSVEPVPLVPPPISERDREILDLIGSTPVEDMPSEPVSAPVTEAVIAPEAPTVSDEAETPVEDEEPKQPVSEPDLKAKPKPDVFTITYLSPKTRTAASTSALGSALGTTGLTSSRGAGEIEGTGSGKPRKKVWNEESLKLKDALGV